MASGSSITGTLPSELPQLLSLSKIDFSSNQITGTIPNSWANFTSLQELYFFLSLIFFNGNHDSFLAKNLFNCPVLDYSSYATYTDYSWYLSHDCPNDIYLLMEKSWLPQSFYYNFWKLAYCSSSSIQCDSNSRVTQM